MNLVILKGHITRDPEMRYTPNGTAVAGFGLAVNEKWTDKDGNKTERVNFFDIEVWAKRAEVVCQWFKKGSPILIQGKLKQDTWDDKETGQKRSKIKITLESFEFCGGNLEKSAGGGRRDESVQPDVAHEAAQPDGEDVPF